MSKKVINKKVLMFSVQMFGYGKKIGNMLQELGYDVDFYDERPNNGVFCKTCIRYNVWAYRPLIRRYIKNIISENQEKCYDYVFVVRGEAINSECLDLLRSAYPQAQFILYLSDSVANLPECDKRMAKYDRVLTFDPKDAKEYQLRFRPLFWEKEYGETEENRKQYVYDFSFVGTAHTIRPLIAKQMMKHRREQGGNAFIYLYLPHPLVYLYNKIRNPAYKTIQRKDISFAPLSTDQIKEIYEKSKCVLDVEHMNQSGLTIRTIEMLGMKKKIITTNASVKEYDFYNPQNIFIIDRRNPLVDDTFWDSEYESIPEEIRQKYSLRYFVQEIFDIEEKVHEEKKASISHRS